MKEYCFCRRCGRKLKSPEARIKGYGVVCEKRVKHDRQRRLFDGKGMDDKSDGRTDV